ncbi:TlpA disulfide reductase family protein [Hydrogenophaga sp. PAMC20947]|uniref:TlpA family protein disulfide reductase n=1 Tax=Hydrogenophaga sp. PAMC20947 TaxID=2565558 RepID=UPI00109D8C9C|nr:TlpA disulfide reductase family protein [Hydrogenophaga sp. PAMC20947]QCB45656.1 TlpA family protein disulfide reductase [Hydrogenophaga sp. PAMC20947]
MKRLTSKEDGPSDPGWTRRRWMQGSAGAAAFGWVGRAMAQAVSAAAEEAQAPPMPALGRQLQVPSVRLLNNTVYEPAQSAGQFLLVYWWSSTCPFCALQSPSMEKLWQQQRSKGLQMLALSIDRKPELASAYLIQKGYTFPTAWASPEWRRGFPKPKGLPITLLCGRDGRLLLAEKGQLFPEDVGAMAQLMV